MQSLCIIDVFHTVYQQLLSDGLTSHSAWRVSFAVVPVPVLLFVAVLTLAFGSDHPAGKWSQRHTLPATAAETAQDHAPHLDHSELQEKKDAVSVNVIAAPNIISETDTAVNEAPTTAMALKIVASPITWLPALSYMTSFGLELAMDGNLATILFNLFHAHRPSFGQTQAGYYTALFGLLNLFTRPLGGYVADVAYKRYGVPGKKWLTLGLSFAMGTVTIGLGWYIETHVRARTVPSRE